jgi:hypothetical protein
VPRHPGDDGVERATGRVPLLERRHLDVEVGPARPARHPRVRLDPQHHGARGPELAGRDAGAAADVHDPTARASREDALDQGLRVPRAGSVVAFGVGAERLRDLAGPMGFGR